MDYTSIHVYGHLLSDDILRNIEQDENMVGNRQQDFGLDISTSSAIDYVWSSLRNDWNFYKERSSARDPYGTRKARDLMERLFVSLDYDIDKQSSYVEAAGKTFDINYLCLNVNNLPLIVIGDKVSEETNGTLDKCSLDVRVKGSQKKRSAHATMLEYLNSTENVYGIISNGHVIRLIRNSGQLVKLTYIEFDLQRMLEEDKYTEFCLMFRLIHASRFHSSGDVPCFLEQWFNMSIESGNRIRNGLSTAVQRTMDILGNSALRTNGQGNDELRKAITDGDIDADVLNKELIHFIYRLLFLFIIEDRNLVYQIPDDPKNKDYKPLCKSQDIYKQYYAASRLRGLSELSYLHRHEYCDLWEGLMETFKLFENGEFGEQLNIKPLGGVLFNDETLHFLKRCKICNDDLLKAFSALNEFTDERGQRVKINYSSLDVEEFGSVYEGILEMRPFIQSAVADGDWKFGFVGGLDRQSTSSYYTRPDLVQSLIRTTLEPVIKERIAQYKTAEEQVKSLLSMKVCDAASGSGHIVLAMARTIAWYVCTLRTGEDNPVSLEYRQALREVIQKCVYAVDYNPDAVELCKVVLWIEGYCAGKPLSFLDHHVRCGNSVVGVANLDSLLDGVPKEAFKAKDDNKEVLKKVRELNKEALDDINLLKDGAASSVQMTLFSNDFKISNIDSEQIGLASKVREIAAMPENTLLEEVTKKRRWEDLMVSPRVECLRRACDIYTYSFYKEYSKDDLHLIVDEQGFTKFPPVPFTRTVYHALEEIKHLDQEEKDFEPLTTLFKKEVEQIATEHSFFHWCVEFPEVFADGGGFDVMCGNPPWDKIKVEDKKWFESQGRADIVNAGNAAQRKRAIANLHSTDPKLFAAYKEALANAEAMSRFVRFSERFPLTAKGDIDLYPMFAELCLTFSKEAWGLVLPTGIAVNDSNKDFFSTLIDENRLISLYDFENREALFDIHRMFKFCLLTAGKAQERPRTVSGGFYLTRLDNLLDLRRIYTMQSSDFVRLNPNTKTCPVFRTSKDAELTAKIYRNSTILYSDSTQENPWKVHFGSMIHMSNDSHLFKTYAQLSNEGGIYANGNFVLDNVTYVPLYEGKMIWHYNHHYGCWPLEGDRPNSIISPSEENIKDPSSHVIPWYWIPLSVVQNRLIKVDKEGSVLWEWKHKWLIGFRDITNATNERTFICAPIPNAVGVGHSSTLLFEERGAMPGAILLGVMSSIPFDYVTRQKIGGSHASINFVKQFPVLTPEQIPSWAEVEIIERVVELCYFNHDLDGWIDEIWHDDEMTDDIRTGILDRLEECNGLYFDDNEFPMPVFSNMQPFIYNEERRAVAQAELDAIFAYLYGLSTEDLRYILDPEDVCGEGCINETFRVLKDNEIRKYGEYRTKRLVLEAWNKFEFGK